MTLITDLPGEEWRDLPGFGTAYQISTQGRVASCHPHHDRLLKLSFRGHSGYRVTLIDPDGHPVTMRVHRLVKMAFDPRPDMDALFVRHRDRNKRNNRLDNLIWLTRAQSRAKDEMDRMMAVMKGEG